MMRHVGRRPDGAGPVRRVKHSYGVKEPTPDEPVSPPAADESGPRISCKLSGEDVRAASASMAMAGQAFGNLGPVRSGARLPSSAAWCRRFWKGVSAPGPADALQHALLPGGTSPPRSNKRRWRAAGAAGRTVRFPLPLLSGIPPEKKRKKADEGRARRALGIGRHSRGLSGSSRATAGRGRHARRADNRKARFFKLRDQGY